MEGDFCEFFLQTGTCPIIDCTRMHGEPRAADTDSAGRRAAHLNRSVVGWWFAGTDRDLLVSSKAVGVHAVDGRSALVSGRLFHGRFTQEGMLRCHVKVMSTKKTSSDIVNRVVEETRRWISFCEESPGQRNVAFALRTNGATVVVAMPMWPCTLQTYVKRCLSFSLQIEAKPSVVSQVLCWATQLVTQLNWLHSHELSHLCVGPPNIRVDDDGLSLGDFLAKATLFTAMRGARSDPDWWMWYPKEVLRDRSLDLQDLQIGARVDAWQLGVTLFFLLTDNHLLHADTSRKICQNIVRDNPPDWSKLERLPLFSDLISRLTTTLPTERLLPVDALRHPVFWSVADVASFKSTHAVKKGTLMDSWLSHVPALTTSRTTLPAPPRAAKPREALSMTELTSQICGAVLSSPTVLDVNLGRFQAACTTPAVRDRGIRGAAKDQPGAEADDLGGSRGSRSPSSLSEGHALQGPPSAPRNRSTREENVSSPEPAAEVQGSRRTRPSARLRSSKN